MFWNRRRQYVRVKRDSCFSINHLTIWAEILHVPMYANFRIFPQTFQALLDFFIWTFMVLNNFTGSCHLAQGLNVPAPANNNLLFQISSSFYSDGAGVIRSASTKSVATAAPTTTASDPGEKYAETTFAFKTLPCHEARL